MMLYVGGIFSNPPPKNNTAMLFNVFLIIAFIIIAVLYYNIIKGRDENSFNSLPKITQMALNMRTKYTIIFMLFVIFMGLLFSPSILLKCIILIKYFNKIIYYIVSKQ